MFGRFFLKFLKKIKNLRRDDKSRTPPPRSPNARNILRPPPLLKKLACGKMMGFECFAPSKLF